MFIPPRSPFGLIQEDLWPDEWKILVSCVMLNCTSRKQVEKVLPIFFRQWPDAISLLQADVNEISSVIKPLGFKDRRTKLLLNLANVYSSNWTEIRSLPGIGEYAARAWEIFCKNKLGDFAPSDHALVKYWNWRIENDQKENARTVGERRKEESSENQKVESRFIKAA